MYVEPHNPRIGRHSDHSAIRRCVDRTFVAYHTRKSCKSKTVQPIGSSEGPGMKITIAGTSNFPTQYSLKIQCSVSGKLGFHDTIYHVSVDRDLPGRFPYLLTRGNTSLTPTSANIPLQSGVSVTSRSTPLALQRGWPDYC
jgi:hypothetical protein